MTPKPVVPHFANEAEEIEFWKTHNVEDYLTGETETLEAAIDPSKAHLTGQDRSKNRTTTSRDAFPFLYADEPKAAVDPNAPPIPKPIKRPIGPAETGEKPS